MSDMVFAAAFKVYPLFSSRRFTSDLQEAHNKGFVTRPAHFNTVSKYMSLSDMTPVHATMLGQGNGLFRPFPRLRRRIGCGGSRFLEVAGGSRNRARNPTKPHAQTTPLKRPPQIPDK